MSTDKFKQQINDLLCEDENTKKYSSILTQEEIDYMLKRLDEIQSRQHSN